MSFYLNYRSPPTFLLLLLLIGAALPVWFVRPGHTADPCTIPGFSVAPNISLNSPRTLISGDFNKDGKPDLAVANARTSGTVSILLGTGNGSFSAPTEFPAGRMPIYIATGDLNGDGNLDLVVANNDHTQGDISILKGDGAGGFGPQSSQFSPVQERQVSPAPWPLRT